MARQCFIFIFISKYKNAFWRKKQKKNSWYPDREKIRCEAATKVGQFLNLATCQHLLKIGAVRYPGPLAASRILSDFWQIQDPDGASTELTSRRCYVLQLCGHHVQDPGASFC